MLSMGWLSKTLDMFQMVSLQVAMCASAKSPKKAESCYALRHNPSSSDRDGRMRRKIVPERNRLFEVTPVVNQPVTRWRGNHEADVRTQYPSSRGLIRGLSMCGSTDTHNATDVTAADPWLSLLAARLCLTASRLLAR
jgi:hypothetical protein